MHLNEEAPAAKTDNRDNRSRLKLNGFEQAKKEMKDGHKTNSPYKFGVDGAVMGCPMGLSVLSLIR